MKNIFILLAFLVFGLQARAQAAKNDSLKIGDAIPIFVKLKNAQIGGKPLVSLVDYKKQKGVIIVYMTNNCYHCINYRERIKTLHKIYAKKGYPVITINPFNSEYAVEDSFEEMQKFAKKDGYNFAYLQVNDEKLPALYGLKRTPTVFLAQKVGKQWLLKYKGTIDDDMENKKTVKVNYVEDAVNALLQPLKIK
ncbi:MAG: thioredoxin family protein [Sphingobacteriales bacterium]|nr:MAG: thioredoxin family protein [Sphingobacteriales bacterium]